MVVNGSGAKVGDFRGNRDTLGHSAMFVWLKGDSELKGDDCVIAGGGGGSPAGGSSGPGGGPPRSR